MKNQIYQPYYGNNCLARVLRAIDGDTLKVLLYEPVWPYEPRIEQVRLANIDAPDRDDDWLVQLVAQGKLDTLVLCTVRLVFDPFQSQRDRFGRLVAFVWIDFPDQSACVNRALVRLGLARHQAYTFTGYTALSEDAFQAWLNRRGIWNPLLSSPRLST